LPPLVSSLEFVRPPSRLTLWLILTIMFLPPTAALYVGSFKLSSGRLLLLILLGPAIRRLFKGHRTAVLCDLFVLATGLCIIAASTVTDGFNPTAISEAFEFTGFYLLGRAFIFGTDAVKIFVGILKVVLIIAVASAAVDIISGRFVVNEMVGQLLSTVTIVMQRPYSHFERVVFGYSFLRAASTFDHPILFGSFCSVCASIFIFLESEVFSKFVFFLLSLVGCLLAGSSAPLLAFAIALFAYIYNVSLGNFKQRWKALFSGLAILLLALFIVLSRPLPWLILHLTLDPETGYFRIEEWNQGLEFVSSSPWVGYGTTAKFGTDFLDTSIDSVWLVTMLNYGVPASMLLLFSNITSLAKGTILKRDPTVEKYCLAFTVVIILFCFNGFTVHYWNSVWQFWALCIGIRASLREYSAKTETPGRHMNSTNLAGHYSSAPPIRARA
jgi:hypothetical protein